MWNYAPTPQFNAPSLKERITGAIQYLSCKGELQARSLVAGEFESAGCGSHDMAKPVHLFIVHCSDGNKNCERCPRFQAYWEGIRQHEAAIKHADGSMGLATETQTHSINSNREPA